MATESYKRADRVGREILRVLSEAMTQRRVSDPRLRGVLFTSVDVTDDLRNARVRWHLLTGEDEKRIAEVDQGFKKAGRLLRHIVAEELALKATPELKFYYDRGVDQTRRIEELLAAIPKPPSDTES